LTITSYLISSKTIKAVNITLESTSIRSEMKSNQNESLWVHATEVQDIFQLQDIFNLHPLEVDSIIHHSLPSKIERYENYIFAIIDGIKEEKKASYTNQDRYKSQNDANKIEKAEEILVEDDLFIFLEHRWIITINFHNHDIEENIKKRIKHIIHQSLIVPSSPAPSSSSSSTATTDNIITSEQVQIGNMNEIVFRLALEEMISTYYPVLDNIRENLEQAEDYILDYNKGKNKVTRNQLTDILLLKRKINSVERTMDMISRAVDNFLSDVGLIDNDIFTIDFSNKSHMNKTKDKQDILTIETFRHMHWLKGKINYLRNDLTNIQNRVINLREAYNSSLSSNLNETIRTLTVIATIVLPLTLITGIYGMNFEFMPELVSPYGYYYALGLLLAVGGGMIVYFRIKGWV
jgi:magnesium transporter